MACGAIRKTTKPDGPWSWPGEAIGSAGLEINLSTTLLRVLDLAPGIGVAYAFDRKPMPVSGGDSDDDEKLQFYLSIKASVNF